MLYSNRISQLYISEFQKSTGFDKPLDKAVEKPVMVLSPQICQKEWRTALSGYAI